jgi:hypothetical protein
MSLQLFAFAMEIHSKSQKQTNKQQEKIGGRRAAYAGPTEYLVCSPLPMRSISILVIPFCISFLMSFAVTKGASKIFLPPFSVWIVKCTRLLIFSLPLSSLRGTSTRLTHSSSGSMMNVHLALPPGGTLAYLPCVAASESIWSHMLFCSVLLLMSHFVRSYLAAICPYQPQRRGRRCQWGHSIHIHKFSRFFALFLNSDNQWLAVSKLFVLNI